VLPSSWLAIAAEDPRWALASDIRGRDPFGGRDCGWVESMRPFIRDFSQPGDSVLDPFCGFGTTLIAAAWEGRRGIGWEVEPQRIQLAQARLARLGYAQAIVVPSPEGRPAEPVDLIATSVPYFGSGWRGPEREIQPSDADLVVPYESGAVVAIAGWFEARGFRLTRWGAPITAPSIAEALPHTEYIRAERLDASGTLCRFDLYFGRTPAIFLEAQRRSVLVDDLPMRLEDDLRPPPTR